MNPQKASDLITENGIFGLGDYDGCMCCGFEVNGVHINVSCRKSGGSSMFHNFYGTLVRVWSVHMDADARGLELVAREVVKQVREHEGHLPIKLRFCDYEHDAKCKCVYCGKPRRDRESYLCEGCATEAAPFGGGQVKDHYAYDALCAGLIAEAMVTSEDGQGSLETKE